MVVNHRVDRGTCPQGTYHLPHFLKKLHDFAADTRLYMCGPLVWLCVMLQSVFEVKVLYVFKYWLTDYGICLMEVFVITVRIPQIGILFTFCDVHGPHFFL